MKEIESVLDWKKNDYHPVVALPDNYSVLDLSVNPWTPSKTEFSIGKYDEVRPDMYTTPIFEGVRNIHVGLDINGPIGTPCMAFADGKITHFGYNSEPGDYGYVIITNHNISGINIWALYGHLSSDSVVGATSSNQNLSQLSKIFGQFFSPTRVLFNMTSPGLNAKTVESIWLDR